MQSLHTITKKYESSDSNVFKSRAKYVLLKLKGWLDDAVIVCPCEQEDTKFELRYELALEK